MTDALEIWIDETPVGDVRVEKRPGHQTESMTFTYRDGWLSSTEGFAISPDLPLQRGPQMPAPHRSTFLSFDDAAPDAWGRSLIDAEHRATARAAGQTAQRLSEIDLLLRVNDLTRQGALRFRSEGEFLATAHGRADIRDLGDLATAARRFEETGTIDDDMDMLIGVGSSPGGARPKAIVHDDRTLLLAKFPRIGDPYDVSAWEAATSNLMALAGIDTPPVSTIRLAPGARILLTPRFDRKNGRRVPYLSFRTAFAMGDGERADYATLARAAARLSASPSRDARELYDRAVFNALVRDHDDHMRNHGFLRTENGWRLAPAFDVNPSRRSDFGTPLVPGGDPFERDVRELFEHSDMFRLTPVAAEERARRIASVISSNWREQAIAAGVEPDALDSFASAFAQAEALAL